MQNAGEIYFMYTLTDGSTGKVFTSQIEAGKTIANIEGTSISKNSIVCLSSSRSSYLEKIGAQAFSGIESVQKIALPTVNA